MDESDPPIEAGQLASDSDRERALAQLRDAVGTGRLTLGELSSRVERTLASRTTGEVAAVLADLPVTAIRRPGAAARRALLFSGSISQSGRWLIAPRTTYTMFSGSCNLNLRDVVITSPEIHITIFMASGSARIEVPRGVRVELGGLLLAGGRRVQLNQQDVPEGAPVVHLHVYLLAGGLRITQE